MKRWIWALTGLLFAASLLTAADRPDYLIRIQRQTGTDLAKLMDAGVPVVHETSFSLFAEMNKADLALLDTLGYVYMNLGADPWAWDYYTVGLRPDSDRSLLYRSGSILYEEENWILWRVPRDEKVPGLGEAKVFLGRLPHKALKPSAPQAARPPQKMLRPPGPQNVVPLVQQMVNSVSNADIMALWTGIVPPNPPGTGTRTSSSQGCHDAGTVVYNLFTGLGIPAQYQEYNTSYAPNVIGTHLGAVNPSKVAIVLGHIDDAPSSGYAPGANDNASGTVHAMEAAKVMSCYAFKNTIKFIAVTGEEQGLLGSDAYATDASSRGETILGALTMDMPAWEGDGLPSTGENLDLNYNSSVAGSQALGELYAACATDYGTGLVVDAFNCPSLDASDHYPFWQNGYSAVCGITDNEGYCGHPGNAPGYHTSGDTIANCGDLTFYYSSVRATIATLGELAEPFKITFDKAAYGCSVPATVIVGDKDLNTNSSTTQTVNVQVWSTWESSPETVTLTEDGVNSMIFRGTIPLSGSTPSHGDGLLSVHSGDALNAQYIDALDCNGAANVTYAGTASVSTDCTPPVISNVQITNISDSTATITWTTNEAANSRVTYGLSTPPGTNKDDPTNFVTSHSLTLTGLTGCTTYYLSVTSADAVGNSATDINGGPYYSFSTYGRSFLFGPDTAESGVGTWTASGTAGSLWHIDTCRSNSPTHAWKAGASDAPTCSAQYGLSVVTDLTGGSLALGPTGHGYHLRWREWYSTEAGYDWCLPQISVNNGSTWTDLMTHYAGASGGWIQRDVDLAAYTGSQVKIRFHFTSDGGVNGEGWFVDDIEISKPAGCGPHANFDSHATIADDCTSGGAGDGNAVWEAGETVQFSVTLKNDGTVLLTGVTATVTPVTAGVTLSDGTASYNSIAVDATGVSLSPHFTAVLPASLACGDNVQFSLSISSDQGTWSGYGFSHSIGTLTPATSTPVNESFSTGDPPTGWSRVNGGTGIQQWTTTNPGARSTPSGMSSPFEIIDGDLDGSGKTQDDSLISPVFDTTGATKVELIFDTYYNDYDANDFAYVDVSTNGGVGWTNHTTWTADIGSAATASHQVLDITALAGTGTNRKIRFHYVGTYGYYWLVDNVQVVVTRTPTCSQTVCEASGPNVQYDGSYNPVTSLVQVCGDGDGVVEPGEDWRVTVHLKNAGNAAATNTVASLAVNAGGVVATIQSGNPGAYGTLASGGGTGTANFVFRVSNTAVCTPTSAITFDVTGISSAEKSYPSQTAAFTVPVGIVSGGGNETKTQQTTPLNATSATVNSNLGATAFTLAAADTATLSYTSGYTPGGAQTLVLQPSTADTFVNEQVPGTNYGTATTLNVQRRSTRNQRALVQFDLSAIPAGSTITSATLELYATAAPTIGQTLDVHHVTGTWTETGVTWTTMPAFSGAIDASTAGGSSTGWVIWTVTPVAQAWVAGTYSNYGFLVKCNAETGTTTYTYTFATRENATTADRPILRVTYTPPAGSWTANARVSLVNPAAGVTVLKAYGAADGSPYNVQPYYTEPGTYQIRLEENNGGTATVTAGSMNVVMNPTVHCAVSSCGSTAPPPVKDTGANAAKFTKGAGTVLNVTYDSTSCSADKVIILYNSIGTWTAYAGCAQNNGGNGGTTTVDPGVTTNLWYNLVWTQGTTAGHPGFATSGGRAWNANGLCGMNADNMTHTTCP